VCEHQPYAAIGARLRSLRLWTQGSDPNQRAWAEKHGFAPTQWNNWEKGARRIPIEDAETLCARYGLTLDWIYRGRSDGLSESLRNVL
jgi:transcriptional regulator with XRE-family HTH domain